MKLSVVTTLYRSAPYIDAFCRRAGTAAAQMTDDYEIILVNDGSPDDSLAKALALAKQDNRIVVIDLSRNFGHHKAMMTGLAHAQGERVFLIDSDLEEEPEWLLPFTKELETSGSDVVYGVQDRRKGGWFERVSGVVFFRLIRWITRMDLPENYVTARLMSRRYVEALLRFQEREVFIGGLWYITGFDQRPVTIAKRDKGHSVYTLPRKLALLVNSITSFSNRPLMMIFYVGISIFLSALIMTGWLVVRWMFYAKPLIGWTSLMVSVWLLGGLIISFIGVVGIYLSKVYSETKQRPYTIVRAVYGR